jgi:hypothetical protein
MLAHAADQMECLGGIGDMIKDDLEHLHQGMKTTTQQALSHSKIESKLQNQEIIEKTMES